MSAVTQAQTEALLSLPGMTAVRIDTVRAAFSERDAGDVEREARTAAVRALGEGRNVCLFLDASPGAVEGAIAAAARRGMGKGELSRRLTDLLGTAASGVLETSGTANVILTGGETARAVCGRMGIRGIRLVKEVETGIPLGVLIGEREIRAVTKAGAFGTRTSLVHALRVLKGLKAEDRPVIALTMGDAAGIGPEIIMKVMNDPEVIEKARIVVIGDRAILERAAVMTGLEHLEVKAVASPGDAGFAPGVVDCIDLGLLPANLPVGRVSAEAGNAAFHYLKKAADLAVGGEVDAICTAPLNKEALHRGGHKYPGHTELLAELTGAKEVAMMLSSPKLKVIHVTTHVGLIDAVALITPERVLRVILLADETLRKAGIVAPRIALCGINPHAGEHGLFGYREEEEKILPAVLQAVSRGIAVFGPLPADTVFFRAVRGDFDIVVAMYHDQGHVPVKVLGFESGVNITLGLPVIRTSVDHGTAFDIAGRGIADDRSMKEALLQAVELAPKRV
jgi:4-hydroxythreonine-4-phosphate dehydrogenase